MKTLALYSILLGAGVLTLHSHLTNERRSHYASLETVELEMIEEMFEPRTTKMFTVASPVPAKRNKEYHIYYKNSSTESIEVAIRYKSHSGEWLTKGFTTLAPGENKLMGLSEEKTYYSYAQSKKKWGKKKWKGDHSFPLKPNSTKKIQFEKQEIWECYDSQTCNSFAVFR